MSTVERCHAEDHPWILSVIMRESGQTDFEVGGEEKAKRVLDQMHGHVQKFGARGWHRMGDLMLNMGELQLAWVHQSTSPE